MHLSNEGWLFSTGNDETKITFARFAYCLQRNHIDVAKSMITPKNVACVDNNGLGVTWYVCCHGRDDASLLMHCIGMGASLTPTSCLLQTITQRKHKLTRAILDTGSHANIWIGNGNALQRAFWCDDRFGAKILMDAGAILSPNDENWAIKWLCARNAIRDACIVVLGLVKCKSTIISGNGRNVLWLISRCMWQNRAFGATK